MATTPWYHDVPVLNDIDKAMRGWPDWIVTATLIGAGLIAIAIGLFGDDTLKIGSLIYLALP
jgi:hypothetical protein